MAGSIDTQVREHRLLLGNPYAYINGEGVRETSQKLSSTSEITSAQPPVRFDLQDPYAHLDGEGNIQRPPSTLQESTRIKLSVKELLADQGPDGHFSNNDIERIVTRLQRQLWHSRGNLVGKTDHVDPLSLLNPEYALEGLGYVVETHETLGQHAERGTTFEVAGIIDRDNQVVKLSQQFRPDVRNFTASHELGHAVLHTGTGLHRDRPLDNQGEGSEWSQTEWQANRFATYFLMPEKQVRAAFKQSFLSDTFVANIDTLSAFSPIDRKGFDQARALRGRSMVLAKAEFYNGNYFNSLSDQFGVSQTAMARRLEELELVS